MSTESNIHLTLGSLFDGSGGFPLGGLLTGSITPLWSSEVEPFAIRVTTKRLPEVKHYGDVSAINGADLPPVDIITFGSPCQDKSEKTPDEEPGEGEEKKPFQQDTAGHLFSSRQMDLIVLNRLGVKPDTPAAQTEPPSDLPAEAGPVLDMDGKTEEGDYS